VSLILPASAGSSGIRRTDWIKFQTHLEEEIPLNPELHTGMAIDKCVENFSEAVLTVLSAFTPKRRPRDY
jgi:hypothetical protein